MSEQELRRIASPQRGYFRADQALTVGLTRRYLSAARARGDIVGVRYGLYRFADHPPTPLDVLYRVGVSTPLGTLSHETALELHGLSDIAARAIHLTVPTSSGIKPRPGVVIHHSDLTVDQRQQRNGLWITRAARTIRDCARARTAPAQLAAAFREATERGLIGLDEARNLAARYSYLQLPPLITRRSKPETDAATARRPALVSEQLPAWELLLEAAARLQEVLPEATLVGGTAAAIVAGHRRSLDADHVIAGLRDHFDEVLDDLEAAAGWRTDRRKRPVVIMGNLDGILTTVRNLRRSAPLETFVMDTTGGPLRLPVPAEILRIKSWLVVDRNVTRDFLDVAAISDHLGLEVSVAALAPLDRLYPQGEDTGAVRQQVMRQLAMPRPADLAEIEPVLSSYKGIDRRWGQWSAVARQCAALSMALADALVTDSGEWDDLGAPQSMSHRHLVGGNLDLAALDDLLENGKLADWRPVLARVAREPSSGLTENIERLLARREYEETGAFWRLFIDHARAR